MTFSLRTRRAAVAVAVAIAASLGWAVASSRAGLDQAGVFKDENGTQFVSLGGTLKNQGGPSGWHVMNDRVHQPLNLHVLRVTDGYIAVSYPHSSGIVTVTATPDETLSKQGFVVGVSADRRFARIYIEKWTPKGFRRINPRRLVSRTGNIWIYGILRR